MENKLQDIRDIEIMEDDRILISYGGETPEEIEGQLTRIRESNNSQIEFQDSFVVNCAVLSKEHVVSTMNTFRTVKSVVRNSLSSNLPLSLTFSPAISALLLLQTGHSSAFCSMSFKHTVRI